MLSYSNTCIFSTIPLNNENDELKINKNEQFNKEKEEEYNSPPSSEITTNNFNVISSSINNKNLNNLICRRYIGNLLVSLPDGIIIEFNQNINLLSDDEEENNKEDKNLNNNNIIKIGDNLFNYLYGKGSQTILLNAFCGHLKRKMYARLKWGSDLNILPFELNCEFKINLKNTSQRLANIQLFCIKQQLNNNIYLTINNNNLFIFTTRHNSYCSIIYLDSNSIPLLGHFPSEVTGKSIFTIVHPDDAHLIRDAHKQLHSNGGTQIVQTSNLRLLTYSGDSILIDSEWAAFVNPWTKHIEMVVGRHIFNNNSKIENNNNNNKIEKELKIGENNLKCNQQTSIVKTILSEPVKNNKEETTISSFLIQQKQNNLSYNQINCIENVHRLLKSQTNSNNTIEDDNISIKSYQNNELINNKSSSSLLTKEILKLHDKKYEEEYQNNWKNKLNYLKRKEENKDNLIENSTSLKRKSLNNNLINYSCSSTKYFGQEINEIINCFHQQQQNNKNKIILKIPTNLQQKNQQIIKNLNFKENPELLEQFLKTANIARNTLAIKLLQKNNFNKQIINQQQNYFKEQQCSFI